MQYCDMNLQFESSQSSTMCIAAPRRNTRGFKLNMSTFGPFQPPTPTRYGIESYTSEKIIFKQLGMINLNLFLAY